MSSSRRIVAPFGLCQDGRIERNPLVEFAADGTLVSVRFGIEELDSMPATEYYNGILIPSLVNAHCHLELSHMCGRISERVGLPVFLSSVSQGSEEYDPAAMALQDRLMWSEGISAVGDVSKTDVTLDVKSTSRMCYKTFVEYYGYGCRGDVESYVAHKTGPLLDKCAFAGLDAMPSPHSTYLVSSEAFAYADQIGVLYTHFMESASEMNIFKQLTKKPFPFDSAVDMLIKLLSPSTKLVLVHCTELSGDDVEKLESFFCDVTYVLCPSSNRYIERSVPPATLLYDLGCKVAIGTDSLASNHSLSIAREIALLSHDNPSISLETLLYWATAGGADALGLGHKMGRFTIGSHCGAVLATGVNLDTFEIGTEFKFKRIV